MRSTLCMAAAALCIVLSTQALADEFYYEVIGPTEVTGPCNFVEHPFPQIVRFTYTMNGYFVFDQPTSGVRFALPDEDFLNYACPGAVLEWQNTAGYSWTGDFDTGVEIDFGECLEGTTLVFSRAISIVDDCVLGGLLRSVRDPGPGYYDLVSNGCDGLDHRVVDQSFCTAPPTNLMPSDGATGVSLTPTVSCDWESPQNCAEGIGLVIYTVRYGTDPANLDRTAWRDQTGEIPIGPLLPGTTYYWRMQIFDDYWQCPGYEYAHSPVMSFTTEGEVKAETRSWGSIKAGYQKKE